MITIELLGVDQYMAEEFVKDIHENVAQIYETKAEDIIFFAPDSFLIYKGVEQTSFQLNVVVEAPSKYAPLEKKVADFLLKAFSETHIHVHLLFRYFEKEHEYEFINENYPRFMTDDNMAKFDTEADVDSPSMEDAFDGYDDKVKEHDAKLYEEDVKRLHEQKNHK